MTKNSDVAMSPTELCFDPEMALSEHSEQGI